MYLDTFQHCLARTSDTRFQYKNRFYWMSQKWSYTHPVGETAPILPLCWPPYRLSWVHNANYRQMMQMTNSLCVLHCTDCVFSIAADWSIIYSQFDSIVHPQRIIPQSYLRIIIYKAYMIYLCVTNQACQNIFHEFTVMWLTWAREMNTLITGLFISLSMQ